MKNSIMSFNNFVVKENTKKYNTEKVSFLSHISHGIRTPLNSIMGFSKLLVLRDLVDIKQKEYVQGILEGSNLLLQFVENVMDLSQFEANNYTVRVKEYNLNQIIWEFTEDFYNRKIENNDTDINLMIVCDNNLEDNKIETDVSLLKKCIQRVINLVSVKYPIEEFELGYRIVDDKIAKIYVRPAKDKLDQNDLLSEDQLYSIDKDNSFDFFNFKVLSSSISMLKGELCLDSDNQEYSFCIPLKYVKNKRLSII